MPWGAFATRHTTTRYTILVPLKVNAMSSPFSFTTTYCLDKDHYNECFDESVAPDRSLSQYFKSMVLAVFGFYFVIVTTVEPYVAWFIVVLGFIEALSVYYRKPWWVGRQMLSKMAGIELTLSFDGHAIKSQSPVLDSEILWDDVVSLDKTTQGWLVIHKAGKNYISSSCLSPAAETFLTQQSEMLSSKQG